MNDKLDFSVVIVFYNPTYDHIENARKLSKKLNLIIVDNSPSPSDYEIEQAHIVRLNENKGIATAINVGLKQSINNGYRYALLLDQDSEPLFDDLNKLVNKAYVLNQERDNKIAVVSPAYFDRAINKRCDFIVVGEDNIERLPSIGEKPINVSYTITSGSVINLDLIENIGFMDDLLFIDFVDIEWCFRAIANGYQVVGIPDVLMEHEIGCEPIRVFGKTYVNHSPIRHYFYFRNAILLMSRDYVPAVWKKYEIIKLVPRFLVYVMFTENRIEHCKKMLRGVYDGLRGKTGAL
ncbi:glycosyltransferase family 2 protein [Vibrio sp. Vb2853]|uniref:glycosyltransferase family 2 protein n=1 Tax=Vibrio TaxID=662 RepID=UPI001BD3C216|nr:MULTISPECIES: glycosyltransferase family 2 protein [Vibrio]MBS9892365.1 glycosyltransferase family 2 protein [Vibrio alginolyticus]MDW1613613.1 glycosyltransferase family 2 protein [Vibrio sp. Vb2881]MDW1618329.1 glycosyltransferase family 2 protein [Vibrio sp. Vb2864]MDW1690560.1 glycosyltransferase family 2 protein [Vibrio sp. Vb2853]MDW1709173.1 glycosyltransferase family 2 protein [Vibrio sp. Vb2865]